MALLLAATGLLAGGGACAAETPALAATTPAGAARLTVERFVFQGNAVLAVSVLETVVAPWRGRPLALEDLEAVAAAVQAHYRSQGFVLATAWVPPQDVGAVDRARVVIALYEGRLGQLRVRPAGVASAHAVNAAAGADAAVTAVTAVTASALEAARVWLARRFPAGQPLNASDLERTVLLAADGRGWQLTPTLAPGAGPGSADLEFTLAADPGRAAWRGAVGADNFGNRFTGTARLQARLGRADLLTPGDQVEASALLTDGQASRFGAFDYAWPLGASDWRAGLSLSRYAYTLGDSLAALQASGIATLAEARLTYPLTRTPELDRRLDLAVQAKRGSTRASGLSEQADGVDLLRLALATELRAPGALLSQTVQVQAGRHRIDDPGQRAADRGAGGPHSSGNFLKLNLDTQAALAVRPGLSLHGRALAQLASRNLAGMEKFVLGGPDRVRAATAGAGAGDVGWFTGAELRQALPALPDGWSGAAVAFIEAGGVQRLRFPDPSSSEARRLTLRGAGVGLRLAGAGGASVQLDRAVPLGRGEGAARRWWLRFSLVF